jgi:hypothetical protein
MEVSGELHSRPFNPGEGAPGTFWMDPTTGLDEEAKRKIRVTAGILTLAHGHSIMT